MRFAGMQASGWDKLVSIGTRSTRHNDPLHFRHFLPSAGVTTRHTQHKPLLPPSLSPFDEQVCHGIGQVSPARRPVLHDHAANTVQLCCSRRRHTTRDPGGSALLRPATPAVTNARALVRQQSQRATRWIDVLLLARDTTTLAKVVQRFNRLVFYHQVHFGEQRCVTTKGQASERDRVRVKMNGGSQGYLSYTYQKTRGRVARELAAVNVNTSRPDTREHRHNSTISEQRHKKKTPEYYQTETDTGIHVGKIMDTHLIKIDRQHLNISPHNRQMASGPNI